MAAILPIALAVAGTAMSAFGQIQQAQRQKAMAEANANLAEQDAAQKQQAAKEEAYKISKERARTLGTQATQYGASGVSLSSGTPLDVLANTAAEYERDITYAGLHGDQARRRGEAEAEIYRFGGEQAATAGWIGAGSTLLTGFGKAYGQYKYGGSYGR
jgi:hypothetical protein